MIRVREHENIFKTYPELLKFVILRIKSSSAERGLRAKASGILKDYLNNIMTLASA